MQGPLSAKDHAGPSGYCSRTGPGTEARARRQGIGSDPFVRRSSRLARPARSGEARRSCELANSIPSCRRTDSGPGALTVQCGQRVSASRRRLSRVRRHPSRSIGTENIAVALFRLDVSPRSMVIGGGAEPVSESSQRPTSQPGGSSKATAVIFAHSRGYSIITN